MKDKIYVKKFLIKNYGANYVLILEYSNIFIAKSLFQAFFRPKSPL